MRKNLLLIVVLSILVASLLVGCGQGQSTPSLTIFSTGGGNVSVMKAGSNTWIEAEVEMSLEPGDTIRSGDNSSAEITFLDGSTIELQAGTEIEVASLDYSADTGSATVVVKQTIGSIIFRVTKIVDPASRYEVETPAGVVAVRGSAVQITVIEDGTTWACNLEGDIWAIAQGVELQIPEGRCCVIRLGQPPKLVCDLTISSTTGGSVTIPGEGTFNYDQGTVVDLTAEAEEGYQFGSWTGDVGTIGNLNATSTAITVDDNCSITANFEVIPLTLLSPPVGSTGVPITNIYFAWTPAGADAYDWVLDDDSDFSSPIASKVGLTTPACTHTGSLAYSTPYYWMVKAYKDGTPIDMAVGTFTTVPMP